MIIAQQLEAAGHRGAFVTHIPDSWKEIPAEEPLLAFNRMPRDRCGDVM